MSIKYRTKNKITIYVCGCEFIETQSTAQKIKRQ